VRRPLEKGPSDMKCRACWAEKAYVRQVSGWKGWLLSCLCLVPLKCHHCYHKFSVPWFFTFGKRLTPPAARALPKMSAADTARDRRPPPRQSDPAPSAATYARKAA